MGDEDDDTEMNLSTSLCMYLGSGTAYVLTYSEVAGHVLATS